MGRDLLAELDRNVVSTVLPDIRSSPGIFPTCVAQSLHRVCERREERDGKGERHKGKSSTERAKALIALAHPQYRDGLTAAAKDMHLV